MATSIGSRLELNHTFVAWCVLTIVSCASEPAEPSMSGASSTAGADAAVSANAGSGGGTSKAGAMAPSTGGVPAAISGGRGGASDVAAVGGSGGRSAPAGSGGSAGRAEAGAGGTAGTAGNGGSVATGDYATCPAAPEPCKILPFGDSITFGIGFAGGYRVELFRKALAAGQHITFLGSLSNGPDSVDGQPFPKQNEGHSGWKIAQLDPLIPSPALNPVPDIVLLMIGTNDIAQRDNLDAAPDRLNGLLDKLQGAAPKALTVVAQITPLGNMSSTQAVETYNMAVRDLVQKRISAGEHILLVDQYMGFPTSELGDGVHPNEMGYARMAGVWYAAISGSLH